MGVTGIGGFFFVARDPEALAAWYRDRMGIGLGEYGLWDQEAGPTVFSPFEAGSENYPPGTQWMLNLRVDGLDELRASLEAAGVEVETRPEWNAPGVGRFARLKDPEGNGIELWEAWEAD